MVKINHKFIKHDDGMMGMMGWWDDGIDGMMEDERRDLISFFFIKFYLCIKYKYQKNILGGLFSYLLNNKDITPIHKRYLCIYLQKGHPPKLSPHS